MKKWNVRLNKKLVSSSDKDVFKTSLVFVTKEMEQEGPTNLQVQFSKSYWASYSLYHGYLIFCQWFESKCSREVLGRLPQIREWSPSVLQLEPVTLPPHRCVLHSCPGSPSPWVTPGDLITADTLLAGCSWTEHAQTCQSLHGITSHWEEGSSGHRETRSGVLKYRSSLLCEASGKGNEGFPFQPANIVFHKQQALC